MRSVKTQTLLAAIVLVLLLGTMALPSAAMPTRLYTFTEKDNGKTVAIPQNNVFKVILPENPTTGYIWYLKATPGLKILDDRYIPSTTSSGHDIVGSGGYHIWTIETVKTGKNSICAVYKRPWEKSVIKTFKMGINVLWQDPRIK